MAGVDVTEVLDDNNKLIRKFGTQLIAIADYSAAAPEAFFDDDGKPKAIPDGYKVMGYITTDGIKVNRSISTSATDMVQDLEPVRTDITAKTRTLQVTFGEANAYTKALAHGIPVAQWPEKKDTDWEYSDGEIADYPYLRLLILMQDGVGADAHYRVEFAYRAKVTAQGDLTKNRTNVEGEEFTFTCFRDPKSDKSYYEGEKTAAAGTVPAK